MEEKILELFKLANTLNNTQTKVFAQITLDYMLSSKYTGKLNIETFGIEMKQAFKLYPLNIVLNIANSKIVSLKELQTIKIGSGSDE